MSDYKNISICDVTTHRIKTSCFVLIIPEEGMKVAKNFNIGFSMTGNGHALESKVHSIDGNSIR